ncbi:GntR family transcriptional regulator [Gulosibacter sp. 10]|uniref:GntR family transcriptional regulator n=1 Tax=Gulosibacter sp. 10 TaxID=1255570 RepID=UPI00097EAD68|nr:GntR family transcriptional regulator [Gulosibacter sp. 10]SJM71060.1 Transcriptional regulator, GntR family [Gulosibacter sp. 10]
MSTSIPRADRVAHGSAGSHVARRLREAILEGGFAPGSRLRQEELAERFEASRVPVREALRLLEAEGLVTNVPNKGSWVARLNHAECDELYRVRERLEPLLLTMSIPGLTPEVVDELRRLADAMGGAVSPEEFLRLDTEFHALTYSGAGTIWLGEQVRRLWNRTQHYRRAFAVLVRAEGDEVVDHDHQLLVAAIAAGDAEEAGSVLAFHIRRTRLQLAEHPEIFTA